MRIAIIGGSNSFMDPGYATQMVSVLRDVYKIADVSLDNFSLGANNCVIGLEEAMLCEDLAQYDRIVVEFAINDYKLVSEDRINTWKSAYEGLIRYILKSAPNAHLYSFILARNSPATRWRFKRLRNSIATLTRHYQDDFDVSVVDFDGYLRRRCRDDEAKVARHYADSAHYARPETTLIMAQYLARQMRLPPPEREISRTLPAPLTPTPFDIAQLMSLPDQFGAIEFANSRRRRNGSPLKLGQSVTFDLPGSLIGLSFLATADGGGLLIEEEGQPPVTIYTCHSYCLFAPNRFVIKNFILSTKSWDDTSARRVKLTSISCADALGMTDHFTPEFSMFASPHEDTSVYLCNAMYYS